MTINEDLAKYPVYALCCTGDVIPMPHIKTIADYNHNTHHIHHYIKQQDYKRDKQWFADRGICQKLFLLPVFLHEQIHNTAIRNLTDEEFEQKFKISRWDLVFNRKYSRY